LSSLCPDVLARNNAIEMLRAARSTLRNEQQAYLQITNALQNAVSAEPEKALEHWVYKLALIYTHQTGLKPAFSNCENETRFERFVNAVPAPFSLRLTPNRLKATIRRLNFKNNADFSRDLNALNDNPQYIAH